MKARTPTLPYSHTPTQRLFITFEGVEGAGKTTQIRLLAQWLEARGRAVVVTREPGGEPVAEAIRAALLAPDALVTPEAELLLFMAARAQVVRRVIRPALEACSVVLCDRYGDSSVVYQGHARGQDLAIVRRLNAFATGGLTPDLTFLLDLDPAAGLARQSDRNRMEAESLAFHQRVREGYLAEAARDPARFVVLDAREAPGALHARVVAAVEALCATD